MPFSPDGARTWRPQLLIGALVVAGFGLTLLVFYPGVMTYDAKFVYEDIAKGVLGDWQSPVMTVLWELIDPIAPGPGSMFLLIATSYWLAFGLLAFSLTRHSVWLAVLLALLALAPPAFVFVGIIWRDVLFAATWLLAAAIAFTAGGRGAGLRLPLKALALGLCIVGVLLRANALIAAASRDLHHLAQRIFLDANGCGVRAGHGAFFAIATRPYGALGATRRHPCNRSWSSI
jgi:hypothetical protein